MLTLVGHGYVGRAIAHELRRSGIAFGWVRHTDRFPVSGPIINAAGYVGNPNVDACEDHKQETMEGNVYWPLQLEEVAGPIPVVHIGSGCVYQGEKAGGYTEDDEPNFDGSWYSSTKILGQKALLPYFGKSYLLRMRMPFGVRNHPKNLLTKFANYKSIVDGRNSLSRIEDVARVAVHFARSLPEPGIYNCVNPGVMWNHEVLEMMKLKKPMLEQEEFQSSVKAPRSFCVLSSKKLQAVFPLDDVRTALYDCLAPETLAEPAVA